MNNFSDILKQLRKQENLTIVELSEEIGYSKSIISYWEQGKKEPTLSALLRLSQYFRISIDELVDSDYIGNKDHLTHEEWELVQDFRGLSDDLRNLLQLMIDTWQQDSHTNKKHQKG